MLPIRDDTPTRTFPLVTFLLILANGLVWLWEVSLGGGAALTSAYLRLGFIPGVLVGGHEAPVGALHPYILTTLTSMFMHGSWTHILGNMLFLWIFGNNIEDYLGHGKYLLFYLVGGVVAALVHLLSGPSSLVQTLVFFIFITSIRLPAWVFLGVWFVMQLFEGTFGAAQGVAVWAHVGGFLFGVLIALTTSRRGRAHTEYGV
jgi:membrane associated rhomboid family serine protease